MQGTARPVSPLAVPLCPVPFQESFPLHAPVVADPPGRQMVAPEARPLLPLPRRCAEPPPLLAPPAAHEWVLPVDQVARVHHAVA